MINLVAAIPSRIMNVIDRYPIAVFFVWAAACSFVYWAFGIHSYVRIPDNADSTLAAKIGLAQQFVGYGFTRWWPVALSGGSVFAQGLAASLDMLLFLVLPGWLGYGALMLLQRWLAGWFMYSLLRDTITIRIAPALYAGMAYALFMQPWRNASWEGFTTYDGLILPALPLIAWALYRLAMRTDGKRLLFAGLLGLFAAIGANVVYTAFIVPVAVCWIWWVARVPAGRMWKPVTVFLASYFVPVVIVNIPVLIHAPHSYRADWTLAAQWYGWEFHFRYIGDILQANLLPLVLIALGIVAGGWQRTIYRRAVFFLGAILLLFITKPLYTWIAAESLGFLNGVAFERVYLGLPFLFIAAGALGLHTIMDRLHKQRGIATVIAVLALSLVLIDYGEQTRRILRWMVAGSNYAAVFQQPQVTELANRTESEPPFRVATVMAHRYLHSARYGIMPQYNSAFPWPAGVETADGYSFIYPQRYQDYWMQVMAPMFKQWPEYRSRFAQRGNRVELFLPSEEYYNPETIVPFGRYFNLEALSILNVRFIISNFKLDDAHLKPVSDGSQYLRERAGKYTTSELLSNYLKGKYLQIPVYIYENLLAKPRVYVVPESIRSIVVLESYPPDELRISIDASSPCKVVHAANYEPGWTAEVNGNQSRIEPFSGALQSIPIPAGNSEIVLRYESW